MPLVDRHRGLRPAALRPQEASGAARAVETKPVPSVEETAAAFVRGPGPLGPLGSIQGTSTSRSVGAAVMVRQLAASSGDVLAAVDALVQARGSPLGDEIRAILARAAGKLDLLGAGDVRLATDAAKTAALLAALSAHTVDGKLDLDAVARVCGDARAAGASLVAALTAAAARPPPNRANFAFLAAVVDALGQTVPKETALAVMDRFLRDDAILPRAVPGLTEVKATVAPDRFVDEGVVAVQHLLPTSLAFFEALLDKGMRADRIHVLGTPYASNPLVVSALRLLGVDAQGGTDNAASTVWFEEHRTAEIHEWLLGPHMSRARKLEAERPPGGYQILDDGGLLQLAVGGDKLPREMGPRLRDAWVPMLQKIFPPGTRAVEQTTRGMTELEKLTRPAAGVPSSSGAAVEGGRGPRFCTVAVAKSAAKAREGDVIGYALAESLLREMAQRGLSRAPGTPVVVVSAGVVGLQTARALKDAGFAVTVVDTDAHKRATAETAGFPTAPLVDRALARESAVILSCTGRTAMSGDALVGFEGLLCSGSSMAIEFNVEQVNAFRSSPVQAANRGRPLNFEGDGHENLTPAQIGIPRALNFAALAQEVDAARPGFVDVDATLQQITVAAWEKAGGAVVPSLHPARVDQSQRPDGQSSSGSARHDEWMAFLSGLARPVCPRPSASHFTPGVYFFEDKDGAVRMVDTSAGAAGGGRSVAVPLPSVPRTAAYVETALPGVPLLVECPVEGGRVALVEVDPSSTPPRTRHVGEADRLARVYVADERSLSTGQGKIQLGFSFFDGDELCVRRPGASQWKRMKLPAGVDPASAIVLWPHKDAFLVVDKETARVHPLAVESNSFFAQMVGRHAHNLPRAADGGGLASVDAVAWWEMQKTSVLVGRDAAGRVAVAMMTPTPSAELVTLPADAVFRGLRPVEDEAGQKVWGRFVVDYTLQGDPVEVEHYRHVVVDWYRDLGFGP